MPWSHPVERMRELVAGHPRDLGQLAGRHAAATSSGDFYTHTRMIPAFDPGPEPVRPAARSSPPGSARR